MSKTWSFRADFVLFFHQFRPLLSYFSLFPIFAKLPNCHRLLLPSSKWPFFVLFGTSRPPKTQKSPKTANLLLAPLWTSFSMSVFSLEGKKSSFLIFYTRAQYSKYAQFLITTNWTLQKRVSDLQIPSFGLFLATFSTLSLKWPTVSKNRLKVCLLRVIHTSFRCFHPSTHFSVIKYICFCHFSPLFSSFIFTSFFVIQNMSVFDLKNISFI